MKTNIHGVGVALVTPFNNDLEIDFAALEALVEYVIGAGADYLVVLGTTAETPTLSAAEKRAVADRVLALNAGRKPVVIGIGGNNTAEVVTAVKEFDFKGVDALLSVTPYYNKPSQEGIYQHYKAVAEASPVPVVLYNVPGRTGVNMTACTTLRLAHDFKNIIAVKEASGNLSQAAYILRDRPEGFLVISGDDNCALPMMSMGGNGVISVAANAFAAKFCKMVHLAEDGNFPAAATLHLELTEATDLLFAEGNPVGVKAALTIKGIIPNNLRLPLVKASDELCGKLKVQIEKYSL